MTKEQIQISEFETDELIEELSGCHLTGGERLLLKQEFSTLFNWQPAPDFIDLEEFDPSVFSSMEVQMKMEIISANLGNRTVEEIKAFFERPSNHYIECPECGHEFEEII